MNIRCPSCQTVFRVDPAKVPAEGIRAKCSRCAHAFRIGAPAETAGAPPAAWPPRSPAATAAPAVSAPPPRTPTGAAAAPVTAAPAAPPVPGQPTAPRPVPATAGSRPAAAATAPLAGARPAAPLTPPRPAASQPAPPSAPTVPAGAPRTPVFGSRDPKARAQRIARALVSDIVAYHKKRVEETLASGRLRTEFRDEIMKSWDEYVAQVGIELAKGTTYFRDALNDILARGQRVF